MDKKLKRVEVLFKGACFRAFPKANLEDAVRTEAFLGFGFGDSHKACINLDNVLFLEIMDDVQ